MRYSEEYRSKLGLGGFLGALEAARDKPNTWTARTISQGWPQIGTNKERLAKAEKELADAQKEIQRLKRRKK